MLYLPAVFAVIATTLVPTLVAQTSGYTPTRLTCPNDQSYIRAASTGLSPKEATWLGTRRPNVISALSSYLSNAAIPGFNSTSYISSLSANASAVPIVGMAFSGGGIRAEYNAYGLYQVFDARSNKSVSAKTGGLSQATSYVGGLSGGCIAVMTLGVNDFDDVQTLLSKNRITNMSPNSTLYAGISAKAKLGFNVSVSDFIGIVESFYATGQDLGNLWSGITKTPSFLNGSTPLPIQMALEAIPIGLPGSNSYDGFLFPVNNATNNTIYEITPFEFGSWQGRASAFMPTELLGTTMMGGIPANSSDCVNGYDTTAWTLGAVVSAFAAWEADYLTNGTQGQFSRFKKRSSLPSTYPPNEDVLEELRLDQLNIPFLTEVLPGLLKQLGNVTAQSATYGMVPNPFMGYNGSDSSLQSQTEILTVDAGESGQESPIWPLIQPARKMDFLIVADNCGSELSTGWMNGTNLINTGAFAKANNVPFPVIPDSYTMLINNYTSEPVFFGCNEPETPLVFYVADFPYSAYTNITAEVGGGPSIAQANILWQNQYDAITKSGNTTWAQCIACGSILRSLERLSLPIPSTCTQCFSDHCWQGQPATGTPPYLDPALVLRPNMSFDTWNQTVWTPAYSSDVVGNSSSGGGASPSAGATPTGSKTGEGSRGGKGLLTVVGVAIVAIFGQGWIA